MASSNSPSSQQPPTTASRRLPPPCWSNDETVALIDAYREKWYSLRRGNLRANHWQEVADGVAARCPLSNPPKTSIQCRHKMEKLRKRYRAEIQRIGNNGNVKGGNRYNYCYSSSWVHFKLMDCMELGVSPSYSDPNVDPNNNNNNIENDYDDNDEEDDFMLYPKGIVKPVTAIPINGPYTGLIGNGNGNVNGNGVKVRIPNNGMVQPLNGYNGTRWLDDYPPSMNRNYEMGKSSRDGYKKEGIKSEKDGNFSRNDVMDEMVGAIQKLADGFVKVERMKMDMAREFESMRMKMEMRRTEMILESQQKLWDSFSQTMLENDRNKKKIKRMPAPEP
ncbi:uncharacterized protein [Rutidosis leptorrhynchoides]|uniref:uncharacterized protein n=1 Tax=Rutidosis leptorrhynchoides TaxID=125765 RepID=UPI003A9939E7